MLDTITFEKLHTRDYNGFVYNLEVEDNHNYFVDDILVSNCHGAKSYEVNKIGKRCINADYRFGFTGTLSDSKIDNMNIQAVLGEKIFDLKPKELIEMGVLSDIIIANIILKYPIEVCKKMNFIDEIKMIIEYQNRNKIFNWIFNKIPNGQNTLILVKFIKHLDDVYDYLKANLSKKYLIYKVFGGTKAEVREKIRGLLEQQENSIIVSNYSVFSQGVNIKKLHNLILAFSVKSQIRVLQSIGRGLRLHENKEKLIVWDIVDSLVYKKTKNYIYKHFLERLKIYKNNNFNFFSKEFFVENL